MIQSTKIIKLLVYTIGLFPIIYTATVPRLWGATLIAIPNNKPLILGYYLIIVLLALYSIKDLFIKKRKFDLIQLCVLGAVLSLYIGPLLSTKFGYRPYLDILLIMYFCVLFSIGVKSFKDISSLSIFLAIRRVLLIYIYGSLIAAVFKFGWAVQSQYNESIIGFLPIRLYGVANHSNNLASIAIVFIIVNFIWKLNSKGTYFHVPAALVVIFFAQSKAVWFITFLLFLIIFSYKLLAVKRRSRFASVGVFLILAALCVIYVFEIFNKIVTNLNSGNYGDFLTFTGRDIIWEITKHKWALNKFFGYGNGLWDIQMQQEYARTLHNWAPAHAHNQFYQTLGTSGIIGIVGLFICVLIIIFTVMKLSKEKRFGLLLMLLLFFIRGFTEPVLLNKVNDTNFFITFIFLLMIIILSKNESISKDERTTY